LWGWEIKNEDEMNAEQKGEDDDKDENDQQGPPAFVREMLREKFTS